VPVVGVHHRVAATPAEVREVFRRINSYTVPLNSEEQRHATYQGPFKFTGKIDKVTVELKETTRSAADDAWKSKSEAALKKALSD